jgi:hypothetical protein
MRRLERSIELKGGPFAMIMWMLPNKEELRAQQTRDKREAFFFFDRKWRQIEYMLSKWAVCPPCLGSTAEGKAAQHLGR